MPSPTETKNLIERILLNANDLNNSTAGTSVEFDLNMPGRDADNERMSFGVMKFTCSSAWTLVSACAKNADKAGGHKLITFPKGLFIPQVVRVKGSIALSDSAATTNGGEIGVGHVIGTGAVATLGGTATFESVLDGTNPGNISAATAKAVDIIAAAESDTVDGTSTAEDLFLNAAISEANTAGGATNLTFAVGGFVAIGGWFICNAS